MWIILVTIPFWTSDLLRVFTCKVILGYNGVVNSGLVSPGVISGPLEFLLCNPTAVVITLAHAWAAAAILPIYVSLEKIDRSLIEGSGIRSRIGIAVAVSAPRIRRVMPRYRMDTPYLDSG